MNLIISTHTGISGSLLNTLDYANYLCNKDDFKLGFIHNYIDLFKLIKKTKRKYEFIKFIKIKNIINCNKLVLDYITLLNLVSNNILIKCNELIIFDCFELTLHLRKIENSMYKNLVKEDINKILSNINYNEVIFNITPFIYNEFKAKYDLPVKKYFKKIDIKALSTININNNNLSFSRELVNNTKLIDSFNSKNIPNIFSFSTFIYNRRKELNYIEQFGRLIFEFKILNKEVVLPDKFFSINDGIKDYVNYYGLDNCKDKINIWNYSINEIL